MGNRNESDRTAVIVKFLSDFLADRDTGKIRTLEVYQSYFPGFEEDIAAEFAALSVSNGESQADSAHPSASDSLQNPRLPSAALEKLAQTLRDSQYELGEEVARGGMGIVMRVWDKHLHRDLAMKIIADTKSGSATPGTPRIDSRTYCRFLDEAQVTGQLAHPGIVPVHDIGIDEQGRVYFTMALIQGEEFGKIIERVHAASESEWSLSRATNILVRVCEAVSFAHSKDVIHRDLKPSNIMIGSFGETYVLDWGLARTGGTERALESGNRRTKAKPKASKEMDSVLDPLHTLEGDVLGTPTYMSPEQARGDLDEIGPRSDVYAIGAILYNLMTGQPPYHEPGLPSDSQAVLSRLSNSAPRSIRSINPNAPAELIAIVEKAMQRKPRDRYVGVASLANDLRAFLEVRVVQAHQTGAWAEAKKWIQRNRSLAATGAIAVLALSAGLVFSILQKNAADEQSIRADGNFQLANQAVKRMLSHVGETQLANTPQMQEVRLVVLQEALEFHRKLLSQRHRDSNSVDATRIEIARALTQVAKVHQLLGHLDDADKVGREAIDEWLVITAQDPTHLADLLLARDQLGDVAELNGHPEDAILVHETGIAEAESYLKRAPEDHRVLKLKAKLLNSLGDTHLDENRWDRAIPLLQEAVEISRWLMEHVPHSQRPLGLMCSALSNLSRALMNTDQPEAAEAHLEEARAIHVDNHEQFADSRSRRHNLGVILMLLSNLQSKTQRTTEARATLADVESIYRKLVAEYPSVPRYRQGLANALNNSANLAFFADEITKALAILEDSADEYFMALKLAPTDTYTKKNYLATSRTLCGLLLEHGQYREAARRAKAFESASSRHGATFLAAASRRAQQDTSIADSLRQELIADYDNRTLANLRAVLEVNKGPKGATRWLKFTKSKGFDPLRERARFSEMHEEAMQRLR